MQWEAETNLSYEARKSVRFLPDLSSQFPRLGDRRSVDASSLRLLRHEQSMQIRRNAFYHPWSRREAGCLGPADQGGTRLCSIRFVDDASRRLLATLERAPLLVSRAAGAPARDACRSLDCRHYGEIR